MSGDITETQVQGGDDSRRSRDLSLPARPPAEVPGYVAMRCLGRGAYGEVWLAVHRNNPGHQVAVKFYTRRGGDWDVLAREVEKLNFLATDSHVVQLLDVGWAASPPYYVMQFFENGSLGRWLENARLSVPDAVAMFREIVVGLVHAHNRGVLHCDLKPDNVLLDKDYRPRLADFGQSRLAGELGPTLGTLFYMPPEQATLPPESASAAETEGLRTGRLDQATLRSAVRGPAPDARWDVFALGALLYGMLTGTPPYRTPQAEEFIRGAENLREQLDRYRRVLLTHQKPTAHRGLEGMDRRLADIVDRCLAVDPARRFANAQAVLDALDARALARARRPVFVLAAAAFVLLLVGVAVFTGVLLQTAEADSEGALTERVLETNRFAAEYGAAATAREIELRWGALQSAAGDDEFKRLVRAASEESDPAGQHHQALHRSLDRLRDHLTRTLGMAPNTVFVTDDRGFQVGRSPPGDGKTVGANFAHRDYFHGQGRDLPPLAGPGAAAAAAPITDVHLSGVYRSKSDGKLRVAFSVPVWANRPPDWVCVLGGGLATTPLAPSSAAALLGPPRHDPAELPWPRLGVLSMSVEPGRFVELHPSPEGAQQTAVLIDARRDWVDVDPAGAEELTGRPRQSGLILQHPRLDAYLGQNPGAGLPRFPHTDLLDDLIRDPKAGAALIRDYRDPLAGPEGGRWLAALAPVEVEGASAAAARTRWVVLVQQRYDAAVAPVNELREHLWTRGLLLLAALAVLTGGLGLFLAWVFNDAARSPLHRFLRKRAGLDPLTTGKPTPLLPLTARPSASTLSGSP